ncbi:hypothetical protein PF004_g17910 [Phytophthora fragariae]|uniref:Protein kinase domain-containing protein n=1 Tax=Phytophthora fragariae TaxID=53985 RepID=A0A6G0NE19_9STRA|nr:hypothetical protein PF004_g17910 [Phytophthora fragariae]
MQATSDPQAAVLQAFYARVMQRVCSSYLVESELPADAVVARLQQKWKQKLALYTGNREQLDAMAEDVETLQVEAAQSPTESEVSNEDEEDDASSVSSASSSSSACSSASSFASLAAPQQAVGRPSSQLPSAAPSTTSSIFAKMLGGKRKLHQLDGSASDDDSVEWQDDKQDPRDEDTTSVGRLPSVVQVQTSNVDEEGRSHNEVGEVEITVRPATRQEEEEEEEKGEDVQQDEEELPSSPAESAASTSALFSADDIAPVSGLSGIDLPLQLAAEYTKFGHRGVRRGSAAFGSDTNVFLCCQSLVDLDIVFRYMNSVEDEQEDEQEDENRTSAHNGLRFILLKWGLTIYRSKDGKWKERWFILDGIKAALIKCNTTNHQPSGSYGSALGGDVAIADARPLSEVQSGVSSDEFPAEDGSKSITGFEVRTQRGATIAFRTKSLEDQSSWLSAINKTSSGFASGVADRLADRELLAGKFSLVRELGRGTSGIVSLYTWQGKPFAIKKFVPQKAKGIPNRRAIPVATGRRPSVQMSQPNAVPDDVRREVALLKKASSLPYVIRLHDVILDNENREYYLVMEYMGGGAIAEWDSSRKCYVSSRAKSAASGSVCLLDESTVRTYVTNLVLAIQGLHLNNLAHRDVKPENLMADEEHTLCKLGDLGVAHYFKEENGELRDEADVDAIELWDINQGSTAPPSSSNSTLNRADGHLRGMIKSTKGTYQFLPPESLSGDAYCAFKADIWAIGVTMYALLFGSLPFYSSDVSELFDKIGNDPLEFPASCEDNDAKDLLKMILEKDPEKRITLEGILQHRWTHRNIDSKSLRKQVNALKQAPTLSIEDHELGSAVSVHHNRFLKMAAAIRHDTLGDLAKEGDADTNAPQAEEEYRPNPVDTKTSELPQWFQPHRELVAAQMHYDWCHGKSLAGWKYGDVRDDARLLHPCMVPMRALDDTARNRNFCSVDEIIKCVAALGVRVRYRRPAKQKAREVPFPMDHVRLSWDIMMLVDLLAENSHEVWATEYAAKGWRFGPEFDEAAKTHPSLKPYMLLDESDKVLTREGVTSVLKSCIYLGCTFSISHRKSVGV